MRYLLTESQYNTILESQKSIEAFQHLVDSKMKYIRRVCDQSADDYEGDVGHESCNQLEQISEIKVTDADWVTIKHSNREFEEKFMSIKLMIYYRSNRQYGTYDADDLTYDLETMIRKSLGSRNIIVNYDTTNTETEFNW